MLEIRLLGRFEVRTENQPIVIPSRLAQSLLAHLLLNRTTSHRREQLAGIFWPNMREKDARHNLRHELWRLRKLLDTASPLHSDLIVSDDLTIGIDPQAQYWLDVAQFEGAGACATSDDLMHTLDLYQGKLLPDFYDEALTLERERLHAFFDQQMGRLLEQLRAEQRWTEMLARAERWIVLSRSPEPAYRALMVAHAALGNRAKVADVFDRCVATLKQDLGVEPSEQTRALYERLAHTPDAARTLSASLPSPSLPTFVVADEEDPEGGRRKAVGGDPKSDGQSTSSFSVSKLATHPSSLKAEAPYKGLQYYDEVDAPWFFGRERLVGMLVGDLKEHYLLTVVGASGSGKSSLVRAGLVPVLRAQPSPETPWAIHVFTPTAHPLEALALALTQGIPLLGPTTTLIDDLARDPRALRLYCQKSLPAQLRLLLVIDQFEELFTLCHEESERQAFINNLLRATAPELDQPVYVVVVLRADFYAHAMHYASLREALSRRQECIGPMTTDEMRSAIEAPAQRGGWDLEAGLVDLILRDVGSEPGALPLLSHALLETWKRRRGSVLTLEGYASCGGVRGAIAQTADTVYRQLSPERQAMARHIFLQLTELGEGTQDTRRRATFEELVLPGTDAGAVHEVLNTLAEARLVTLGESTAEVAHEALIREWPALREWLNQNRDALRLHRHLTEAAQSWERMNRDQGELYRGIRLAQALEWVKTRDQTLTPQEHGFLEASKELQAQEEAERERQHRRELEAAQKIAEVEKERAAAEGKRAEEQTHAARRLRRRAVYLASALLLAAVLAFAAILFAQQSSQNERRAEIESNNAKREQRIAFVRELSVNSVNNLTIDPERSILLALQAVSLSTAGGQPVMREAEEALHRAVPASRVQLTLHGHTAGLYDIAFSPDGKRLATASVDKTAKVWDVTTGRELLTLCCHADTVIGIDFSPDGTRIATASGDQTTKIWDAVTGKELFTLRGHTGRSRDAAFSPDGKRLATSSQDRTAKVWDVTTGQELFSLVGHTGGVANIAYSLDGRRIATVGWADEVPPTIRIWDAASGNLVRTLTGHTSTIYDVAFSPDSQRVASSSLDKTAKVWDVASGQMLLTLFDNNGVLGVAFSLNGSRVATASGDGVGKVWDATTGLLLQTLAGHASAVNAVAFSPDGLRLATASADGTARVWDITPAGSREVVTLAGHEGTVWHVASSPDGTRLATAGTDKTARIWDAATGQQLLSLSGHTNQVAGVSFSPDGSRVATLSLDQTARLWDARTGQLLFTVSAPVYLQPWGPRVPFSPDGRRFAAPSAGGGATLWDAATGQAVLAVCCHPASYVLGISFSPDGTRLATAGFDGQAKVWDSATGKELFTLAGHTSILDAAVFSPDGRRIATGSQDGTAKVWDGANGRWLLTLSGHVGIITDLAFSPDGERLATTSSDATIKLWDVSPQARGNEQPLTFYNPNPAAGGFCSIAFSPDGKRMAAASAEGTVRVYALPLEDIVSIAKSRVTRTLTTDECQKYLHVEQCPKE